MPKIIEVEKKSSLPKTIRTNPGFVSFTKTKKILIRGNALYVPYMFTRNTLGCVQITKRLL